MGCFDPFERDLSRASDAREQLAEEVARLQRQLQEALGLLAAKATQDPTRWAGRAEAVRERTEPILRRAYDGRFQWSDAPPMRGTEDAPGGPFPDFGAVHALLGEAEDTRLTLERILCEVRSALVAGMPTAPMTPEEQAERALHLTHRREDRDVWLRHAHRHVELLELRTRAAAAAGLAADTEGLARWQAAVRRVEALDDDGLLDPESLPPLPGLPAR
jgi:hypothetical protein